MIGVGYGKRFKVLEDKIRQIMPRADRYDELENADSLKNPQVAATVINYYEAQAIAQLLGGQGLIEHLFGLSGVHYINLPNENEWGLLAMEGQLKFMVNTKDGKGSSLTDKEGNKLRVHRYGYGDKSLIEPPTNFDALSNGIFPNTVMNWVKNLWSSGENWHVLRGTAWNNLAIDLDLYLKHFRVAYRSHDVPHYRGTHIGLRVVVSPESS